MAMGDYIQLDLLRDWWLAYLLRQSHHVVGEPENIVVIRSRNGKRKPYRWLMMTCEGPARVLTREERGRLRKEIALASRSQERPYVVVGFLREPRKIVVVPAASAMRARLICSDVGGIAWEE
jgi:hypothetical protein